MPYYPSFFEFLRNKWQLPGQGAPAASKGGPRRGPSTPGQCLGRSWIIFWVHTVQSLPNSLKKKRKPNALLIRAWMMKFWYVKLSASLLCLIWFEIKIWFKDIDIFSNKNNWKQPFEIIVATKTRRVNKRMILFSKSSIYLWLLLQNFK